jgi:hypothetical protein
VETPWINPPLSRISQVGGNTTEIFPHIHSPYDEALNFKLFKIILFNHSEAKIGNQNGFSTFVLENLFSYTEAQKHLSKPQDTWNFNHSTAPCEFGF